jgi:hypothetical protein
VNKPDNNVGGGNKEKKKDKFPCKLCKEDRLTHQCPKLEEAQCLLARQQNIMLTNPFPQGQHMAMGTSSNTQNLQGGN